METDKPLVETVELRKWFTVRQKLFRPSKLKAVDGVDLSIGKGAIGALIGESGCGKSTLGQLLVRLQEPTAGAIKFAGTDITQLSGSDLRKLRRRMQIIFQNPYETLDTRYRIETILEDPLRIHNIGANAEERKDRMRRILRRAGLEPADEYLRRFPHELSGGQVQRVVLARVMLLEPEFLVADEPVSMLDVSVRAEVLNFLLEMRDSRNMSVLFITHDIGVARYVADWFAVMYLGRIVEEGPADDVVANPLHPYTRALIRSAPSPDPERNRKPLQVKGEPSTPIDPPPACRFVKRCPYVEEVCHRIDPELIAVKSGHNVACHMYEEGGEHSRAWAAPETIHLQEV